MNGIFGMIVSWIATMCGPWIVNKIFDLIAVKAFESTVKGIYDSVIKFSGSFWSGDNSHNITHIENPIGDSGIIFTIFNVVIVLLILFGVAILLNMINTYMADTYHIDVGQFIKDFYTKSPWVFICSTFASIFIQALAKLNWFVDPIRPVWWGLIGMFISCMLDMLRKRSWNFGKLNSLTQDLNSLRLRTSNTRGIDNIRTAIYEEFVEEMTKRALLVVSVCLFASTFKHFVISDLESKKVPLHDMYGNSLGCVIIQYMILEILRIVTGFAGIHLAGKVCEYELDPDSTYLKIIYVFKACKAWLVGRFLFKARTIGLLWLSFAYN